MKKQQMMMSREDYDPKRCNEIISEIFEKYKASKEDEGKHEKESSSNRR